MATKRATGTTAKKTGTGAKKAEPKSMPKAGKDPKGGLTAKGREYFAEKEGAHLRPGVKGKADTPEKKVRKGSFLRRHFAHPRGPMERDGEPTRLALSAQAWGEPLPKSMGDAKKLAGKGKKLLEEYHAEKDAADKKGKAAKGSGAKAAKKSSATKSAAKNIAAKKGAAKKVAAGSGRTKLAKTPARGKAKGGSKR